MATVIYLLSIFSLYIVFLALKQFHKLCWTPFKIQRVMQSQGINGPPFSFIHGNKVEITEMRMEAMRRPLQISDHNILPRVHPHIDLWINKYGKNFLQWNGTRAQLIITDLEMAKEVLYDREQNFPRDQLDKYTQKIFGSGLVTSDREKWTKSRRIADYAFHGEILKNMVPTIISCAETMLQKWKHYENKELDLFEEFKVFTSDIIAHTAFGSSYLEGKIIFENLHKLSMLFFRSRFKKGFLGISKFFTKNAGEGEELEKAIKDSIAAIIRDREEKAMSGKAENYGNDFLGLLLKVKNDPNESRRISLNDVVDDCKTIYFAGHDTTTSLLSWTAFLLATHQHWQDEARKEVFSTFGNENPTFEGISKLKTMSMIIKECLRLYPPAPSIMTRSAKKKVKLGQLTVPAHMGLSISTIALHHDAAIWGEDAHLFKPERFAEFEKRFAEFGTDDKMKSIPLGAYIPFGLGPRNCVGNMLATNEAKITMSMILQRYSLSISASYVHAPYQFINIFPQHGVQVKLHSLGEMK